MTMASISHKQDRGMIAHRKPLPCLPLALPIKLAKGKQGKGGSCAQPKILGGYENATVRTSCAASSEQIFPAKLAARGRGAVAQRPPVRGQPRGVLVTPPLMNTSPPRNGSNHAPDPNRL